MQLVHQAWFPSHILLNQSSQGIVCPVSDYTRKTRSWIYSTLITPLSDSLARYPGECICRMYRLLYTRPKRFVFQLVEAVLLPLPHKVKDLRNVPLFLDICCFRHLFFLQFKKLKQVKPQNCYQSCEIKAYFGGKLWFCLFCFLIKPIKKDHSSYFPTLVQPTHYFSRQVSAAASLTVKSDQIICKNTCSEGVGIHDMQLLRYASTFRRQLVIAARHFGLAGCRTRIKLNRLPKDLLINFLQD